MSERKMREDRLGRDPDGSGLSQAEPSGLGPSDFDPSREAWSDFEPDEIVRRVRCLADDAPDEGDSPAQIWRHACDTILLRMGKHPSQDAASWPRRPMPGLSEQGYRMAYDVPWLRDWRARTGMTLQEAMATHDKALRASDERPTGPRPSGLGAEPASPVDGACDGEAPDLIDELDDAASILRSNDAPYCADVVDQAAQTISNLFQEVDALREALRWYVDNDDTVDGMPGNEFWLEGRDRARALLGYPPATDDLKVIAVLTARGRG